MTIPTLKRYSLILVIAQSLFASATAASECGKTDQPKLAMAQESFEQYVEQLFQAGDDLCGMLAAELQARELSDKDGEIGSNARFALRNFTLRINQNEYYLAEMRLQFIKTVVFGLAGPPGHATPSENKFNVLTLLKAGEEFRLQQDTGSWLEALAFAIQLDLRMAEVDRTIRPGMVHEITPSSQTYKNLGQLVTLAELTQGVQSMASFRSQLAFITYYQGFAWTSTDSSAVIADRAKYLLQLAAALGDVHEGFGLVPAWHWKPVMQAGTAYYRIGVLKGGTDQIRRAIGMARAIENPDERLGQYRFVLDDLHTAKYDRSEILAFVDEMKALAESLDTPLAKEVRESLTRAIKNWGLDKTP